MVVLWIVYNSFVRYHIFYNKFSHTWYTAGNKGFDKLINLSFHTDVNNWFLTYEHHTRTIIYEDEFINCVFKLINMVFSKLINVWLEIRFTHVRVMRSFSFIYIVLQKCNITHF